MFCYPTEKFPKWKQFLYKYMVKGLLLISAKLGAKRTGFLGIFNIFLWDYIQVLKSLTKQALTHFVLCSIDEVGFQKEQPKCHQSEKKSFFWPIRSQINSPPVAHFPALSTSCMFSRACQPHKNFSARSTR